MRFKVPQNVQIEDRILPFLTLRQLIICVVGGGLTYLVYLNLEYQNPEIWLPPIVILGGLTLAIAFLKVQGIRFVPFLFLLIERYLTEQKRIWLKSPNILKKVTLKSKQTPKSKKTGQASIKNLSEISKIVDNPFANLNSKKTL